MSSIRVICIAALIGFLAYGCQAKKSSLSKNIEKKAQQAALVIPSSVQRQDQEDDAEVEQLSAEAGIIEEPLARSNPFLAVEEENYLKKQEGKLTLSYLHLTAVFYSPPLSKAIIGGRIFKEGDLVDNKEIVKINPEDVILKDAQGEYVVSMKNVLGKDS